MRFLMPSDFSKKTCLSSMFFDIDGLDLEQLTKFFDAFERSNIKSRLMFRFNESYVTSIQTTENEIVLLFFSPSDLTN